MKLKQNWNLILASFASIALAGCVSGPKNLNETFTQKLNGDGYQSSATVMGVPVLERQQTTAKRISGHVQCGVGVIPTFLNHAKVELIINGRVVSSVSTDIEGQYSVRADTAGPESAALLKVSSARGELTEKIALSREMQNIDHDVVLHCR